jgi:pyruvate dehydrogenase E1 component
VYDPAFAYELAVVIRDGIERMYGEAQEDCFYYVTLYNENLSMPPMPEGVEEGIVRGLYKVKTDPSSGTKTQIFASGTAMSAALEAQALLAADFHVSADVWSATSYKALREDALSVERWNRLHPAEPPRRSYLAEQLATMDGPVVAVTDFVKAVPDQIGRFVDRPFVPLGTDGYGFSDTRVALREHFEVDARHVVVAALHALAEQGQVPRDDVAAAIARYEVDSDRIDPRDA